MERLKHVVEINIILGAWLVVAPFVMGYSGSRVELANDVVIGAWLIGCSWWTLAGYSSQAVAGTLEMLAGIWLVAAPFVLRSPRTSRSFDNDIAVGLSSLIVSAATTWMVSARRRTAA
jgi:hypothetical protein